MVAISLAEPAPADVIAGAWAVPVGCPVEDVAGERVGTVAAADADHLAVEHRFFFRPYLVPLGAVASFDGRALRLAVTKAAARRGAWGAGADRARARRPASGRPPT